MASHPGHRAAPWDLRLGLNGNEFHIRPPRIRLRLAELVRGDRGVLRPWPLGPPRRSGHPAGRVSPEAEVPAAPPSEGGPSSRCLRKPWAQQAFWGVWAPCPQRSVARRSSIPPDECKDLWGPLAPHGFPSLALKPPSEVWVTLPMPAAPSLSL